MYGMDAWDIWENRILGSCKQWPKEFESIQRQQLESVGIVKAAAKLGILIMNHQNIQLANRSEEYSVIYVGVSLLLRLVERITHYYSWMRQQAWPGFMV